jgi:drug/metabolite transporter (DMT)-like permease
MRGVLWMVGAMTFFSILTVLVRYLADTIPAAEQGFIRGGVTVTIMVAWQLRKGLEGFRTRRLGRIGIGAAFIALGVWTWFHAVGIMKLADAVALHFTLPLFGILLATIFLRERPTVHRWAATVIGFSGALVILRPGFAAVELVGLMVLFSAFCYAAGSVFTKELVRTEPPDLIVLYMNIYGVVYFAVPAYLTWVPPGLNDWMLLFGLGLATMAAQVCYTRGLTTADASYLFPVEFLRLPMTAGAGIVLFAEELDAWTAVGALIIFGSTYYITRERPARSAAPDAAPNATPNDGKQS